MTNYRNHKCEKNKTDTITKTTTLNKPYTKSYTKKSIKNENQQTNKYNWNCDIFLLLAQVACFSKNRPMTCSLLIKMIPNSFQATQTAFYIPYPQQICVPHMSTTPKTQTNKQTNK